MKIRQEMSDEVSVRNKLIVMLEEKYWKCFGTPTDNIVY